MGTIEIICNICSNFWKFTQKKDFLEVWKFVWKFAKLPKSGSLRKTSKIKKDFQTLYLCGFADFQERLPKVALNFLARVRVITWKLYTPKGVYITSNVISLGSLLNFQNLAAFFSEGLRRGAALPFGAARCNPSAKKAWKGNQWI